MLSQSLQLGAWSTMSVGGSDSVTWEEDGWRWRDGESQKQHCFRLGRASSLELVQEGEGEPPGGHTEGEVTKWRPGDMY